MLFLKLLEETVCLENPSKVPQRQPKWTKITACLLSLSATLITSIVVKTKYIVAAIPYYILQLMRDIVLPLELPKIRFEVAGGHVGGCALF